MSSSSPSGPAQQPRMFNWLLATVVLMAFALLTQSMFPGALIAVTLYKAHLMVLGGWGGYWLDRALFPYDRPHEYLTLDAEPEAKAEDAATAQVIAGNSFSLTMMRRAIIVAACLICVGMGA